MVNVTSGPGGTNAITGVYGAFVDSMGMLVISGQVKIETTVRYTGLPLRQYGDQELDIERIVRPITKYATMVTDPQSIRYHLEKAIYLATSGRPGPCWLDIPLDVQAAMIDPDDAGRVRSGRARRAVAGDRRRRGRARCPGQKLVEAERPVVFAGSGVRLSGQHEAFLQADRASSACRSSRASTAATMSGRIIRSTPGGPGTIGDRGGNMVTQSADFLLVLGSRLNIRQVSYNWAHLRARCLQGLGRRRSGRAAAAEREARSRHRRGPQGLHPGAARSADYAGPTDQHREWLDWALERKREIPGRPAGISDQSAPAIPMSR